MLGFMAFTSSQFWLSLYLQEVRKFSPLQVAVYLIPQAIAGILYNIMAGLLMHCVRNEYLMFLGAVCYTGGTALLATMKADSSYWAFIFPALILMVVGADFEFNIANVSLRPLEMKMLGGLRKFHQVFVSSSFPKSQQAHAGGILNMFMRLCVALGLALTTAIYSSMEEQYDSVDITERYKRAFYLCVAFSGISAFMCPWMRIGCQGTSIKRNESHPETARERDTMPSEAREK